MKTTWRSVILQVPLVLWSLVVIVPFLLITVLAFRPEKDIFAHPLGFGGSFTFDNIITAWNGPAGGTGLGVYLGNSAAVTLTALVVTLAVGCPAGYFTTLLPPKLRARVLAVFLVAQVVPLILLVVPYFQIFDALAVTNNPVAVGVTYGVIAAPTTVLVLHAFFRDFPSELTEAAEVDGLGPFSAFVRIVMPLSLGAVVGVAMLALIFVWGESQLGVVLMQAPESQSVPVGMLNFKSQFAVQLGPIFGGLAIASVPIIVIYLVFSRFITKGIALGGVFR